MQDQGQRDGNRVTKINQVGQTELIKTEKTVRVRRQRQTFGLATEWMVKGMFIRKGSL